MAKYAIVQFTDDYAGESTMAIEIADGEHGKILIDEVEQKMNKDDFQNLKNIIKRLLEQWQQ